MYWADWGVTSLLSISPGAGREGIGTRWVIVDDVEGTGVAFPLIEPDGQNSIVIVPRANRRLTSDDILARQEAFDGASVLLVQMEVNLAAVWEAIDLAHQRGLSVLFNPAPVPDPLPTFPAELWTHIDFLLPNEHEVEALTGLPTGDIPQIERAARILIERGCRSVVVTLGSRGALWVPGIAEPSVMLPPFSVQQVDATAAGDAFCGVLAAGLAAGQPPLLALRRASAAGALATTRLGAEPSLPTTAEIDRLLGE